MTPMGATTSIGTYVPPTITNEILLEWQMNLIDQLTSYTLEYIGLALVVVLGLGGALYFFSIRPFEKEQQRQSEEMKSMKVDLLKAIDDRLSSVEKKAADIASESIAQMESKLKDAEKNILTQAMAVSDVGLSKVREEMTAAAAKDAAAIAAAKAEFITEVRKIEDKLDGVNTNLQTAGNDIDSLKTSRAAFRKSRDDFEMRIRGLETYVHLKENKRGSYLIPLRTLEEHLESKKTLSEWDITQWLNRLRDGIDGEILEDQYTVRINKVLSALPGEFDPIKDEIRSKMQRKDK